MKKAISWIDRHRRVWRMLVLALALLALAGPWVFDRVHVPAQYSCDPPFVRLEGDFCGYPLSGMFALYQLIVGFVQVIRGLVAGTVIFSESVRGFRALALLMLALFFLLLPLFGTLRLIARRDPYHGSILPGLAWGAATALSFLLTLLDFHWAAWGRWLYTGVAVSALTLEVLALIQAQKASRSLPETTGPS